MVDELTQRHLNRLRTRGAPSTIPGTAGFVGIYDADETWRPSVRALALPIEGLTIASLGDAFARLRDAANNQKLTATEEPLFVLKADPNVDPPHTWRYEAILPIRGAATPRDDIAVVRVDGGMHLSTRTPRGLADLRNVYVHLFGKLMPSRKQQLMRPYILHRAIAGMAQRDPAKLTVGVYVPAALSIKRSGEDRAP